MTINPTTTEGRNQLRELLTHATPGTWTVGSDDGVWARVLSVHRVEKDGWVERLIPRVSVGNAELIVAAVNALPQLLDALDAKDRQIDVLCDALEISKQNTAEKSAAIERVRAVIADLDQPTFVSTLDALEELPLLTVVRDRDGEVYERSEWESLTYDHSPCLVWVSPGDPSDQWMYPKLPAQILYTPKETRG